MSSKIAAGASRQTKLHPEMKIVHRYAVDTSVTVVVQLFWFTYTTEFSRRSVREKIAPRRLPGISAFRSRQFVEDAWRWCKKSGHLPEAGGEGVNQVGIYMRV